MQALLSQLLTLKILRPIDYHLAIYLGRNDHEMLIIALLSHAEGLGHSLLYREQLNQPQHWFYQTTDNAAYGEIYTAINACLERDHPVTIAWKQTLMAMQQHPDPYYPIVIDEAAIYFAKYFNYETKIAQFIAQQRQALIQSTQIATYRAHLNQLFPSHTNDIDWQKIAAAIALNQRFSVISGGPGTGKTTTVAKILAAILMTTPHPEQCYICLAAPTGKAAARLGNAIVASCQGELMRVGVSPNIIALIPKTAMTLHRLLGLPRQSPSQRIRTVDVLLIDEASMIDIAMMYQIITNLSPHTRLILLGDQNQLTSVAAGAILAELCQIQHYSAQQIQMLMSLVALPDSTFSPHHAATDYLACLHKSYRFNHLSAIGHLASAVNAGNIRQALAQLKTSVNRLEENKPSSNIDNPTDVVWEYDYKHFKPRLMLHIQSAYADYQQALSQLEPKDPSQILALLAIFENTRILCAERSTLFGVDHLNNYVQTILFTPHQHDWYHGRPILITENDYRLNLFNGDVGITIHHQGKTRVYFNIEGVLKSFVPAILPQHETAFAMTVHKSQGSEFNNVILILPAQATWLTTRELLYTGITRTRRYLSLFSPAKTLIKAIKTPTKRASQLQKKLQHLLQTP